MTLNLVVLGQPPIPTIPPDPLPEADQGGPMRPAVGSEVRREDREKQHQLLVVSRHDEAVQAFGTSG